MGRLNPGVPVKYQLHSETPGDFVRLIDWAKPLGNEWLAVNQFSIKGPQHTRRPDVFQYSELPVIADGTQALLKVVHVTPLPPTCHVAVTTFLQTWLQTKEHLCKNIACLNPLP